MMKNGIKRVMCDLVKIYDEPHVLRVQMQMSLRHAALGLKPPRPRDDRYVFALEVGVERRVHKTRDVRGRVVEQVNARHGRRAHKRAHARDDSNELHLPVLVQHAAPFGSELGLVQLPQCVRTDGLHSDKNKINENVRGIYVVFLARARVRATPPTSSTTRRRKCVTS